MAAANEAEAAAVTIEHDYIGARKCRTCHKKELIGNQYATWRAGPHGRAFATLESPASLVLAQRMGLDLPPGESPECLGCHTTAFGVSSERMAYPLSIDDGVQCESCHGPGRDYRKKKIMSDVDSARAKGLWNVSERPDICTTCHNRRSPTFDPERYVLSDGTRVGFDFEQARLRIAHPIPETTKGRYLELEQALKEAEEE